MQNLTVFAAIAATAALAAGSAFAAPLQFKAEAKLANSVAAPKEAVINGVNWRCEGDTCVGEAQRYSSLDGPMRECKKVVAQLGALTAYETRGRVLSAGTIRVCNTAAATNAGDAQTAQK